ncbi:hypothetical protein JXB01_02555 [Candidatus Micrarchaeota archaeon]|nr:hypothetical protein [Candidatus Micrarchaeota archaeon]
MIMRYRKNKKVWRDITKKPSSKSPFRLIAYKWKRFWGLDGLKEELPSAKRFIEKLYCLSPADDPRIRTRWSSDFSLEQQYLSNTTPSNPKIYTPSKLENPNFTRKRPAIIEKINATARFIESIFKTILRKLNVIRVFHLITGAHYRGIGNAKMIEFPPLTTLMVPNEIKKVILIHELTHHYQSKTPLKSLLCPVPEDKVIPKIPQIISAVIEGLARYAETEYCKTTGLSSKSISPSYLIRKYISRLFSPVKTFRRIVKKLLGIKVNSHLYEQNPSRYAKYFDEYIEGHTFVKQIIDSVGTEEAWKLLTSVPPETMEEFVYPALYLKNMDPIYGTYEPQCGLQPVFAESPGGSSGSVLQGQNQRTGS